MTHYCPKCKSTHNLWNPIDYGQYLCPQCGYILVWIKKKNALEILENVARDMRKKKNG